MPAQPRIAAIISTFFPYSHADVIVSKFLRGFPTDGHGLRPPRGRIAAACLDQVDPRDIGQGLFFRYDVDSCQSIRQALTARGGNALAVDGVLLIGEHGDYPTDELGRQLYPRRAMLEQIAGVFAECGTACPVFCDKGLGHSWEDATWMVRRCAEVGAPLMAGSSLPVAWRRPWLEPPLGASIDRALAVGYGEPERYGFHAVETLQCMVERRSGGEVGVSRVEYLEGDSVWRAVDAGRINRDLLRAALSTIEELPDGDPRERCERPMAFVIDYRDGLSAAVVLLNGYVHDFAFAGGIDGRLEACEVYLQRDFPHGHFNYLSLNIEEMFVTGRPSWPAERTLLTTGITDAAMRSRHAGSPLETPWMEVRYVAPEAIPWRTTEPRPTGANLEPWPPAA